MLQHQIFAQRTYLPRLKLAPRSTSCAIPKQFVFPWLYHGKNMTNGLCHFFFLRSTTMLVSNAGMVILYALLQVFRKKSPKFFLCFSTLKKNIENASPWFDPCLMSTSIQKDLYHRSVFMLETKHVSRRASLLFIKWYRFHRNPRFSSPSERTTIFYQFK